MERTPDHRSVDTQFEQEVVRASELVDAFDRFFHGSDGLIAQVNSLEKLPSVAGSPEACDLLDKLEDDLHRAAIELRARVASSTGITDEALAEAIRRRKEVMGED